MLPMLAKIAGATVLLALANVLIGCGDTGSTKRANNKPHRITVIGSGNWGSVAARIAAQNALKHEEFEDEVRMWVFDEIVDGKNLSSIINEKHENVKYLKGISLGTNLRAVPNLTEAVSGASLLIFVTPHQFIKKLCPEIKAAMASDAKAISLIKGWDVTEDGFQLISGLIERDVGIETSVLMGANLANEIALEEFSEATVGYPANKKSSGDTWVKVFHTNYFSVRSVPDVAGCELCGTMKNIVALGAGYVDG
jgi:glycerol-3-phosphate dehydrogenase (NAD+)